MEIKHEAIDSSFGELSFRRNGSSSAETVVVLAHGAGAGLDSPFMEAIAHGIAAGGPTVYRFNFPYMQQGRKSPDRQPVLESSFQAVLGAIRAGHGPRRLVAGGKSLGGRIACHIAAVGEPVDGLVFLGYPLHPPGRPDRLRSSHLKALTLPMLFIAGTRDPFAPLATLEGVVAGLSAPADVAVIEGGDHSFKVLRSSGRSTEQAWAEAASSVAEWIGRTLG